MAEFMPPGTKVWHESEMDAPPHKRCVGTVREYFTDTNWVEVAWDEGDHIEIEQNYLAALVLIEEANDSATHNRSI